MTNKKRVSYRVCAVSKLEDIMLELQELYNTTEAQYYIYSSLKSLEDLKQRYKKGDKLLIVNYESNSEVLVRIGYLREGEESYLCSEVYCGEDITVEDMQVEVLDGLIWKYDLRSLYGYKRECITDSQIIATNILGIPYNMGMTA